jgi:hypothetical protein
MCRANVINLQTSNKICISRKVIIIYSDTWSTRSSEDESIVLCVDAVNLQVDTVDWEKYAVSMLSWSTLKMETACFSETFFPLQVHTASNATRKSIVVIIWIQHVHSNSTSVRSILIVASYQSQGLSSGLSFSSLRTTILCAFVAPGLHTNRPTHMTVLDFIIPIYNVWWRVQII